MAFTFLEPEKILNNKSMDTKLYEGWYLDEYYFEKTKAIKSAKKLILNSLNNILESRNYIHSHRNNFDMNEMTLSRATIICSLKDPEFDETWHG